VATEQSTRRPDVATSLKDAEDLVFQHECRDLAARISQHRERADRLRLLATYLDEQADRDEYLLGELRGALGLDPQLRLEQLDRRLRGRRLREVALEILASEVGPWRPIHYKQWYSLVCGAGFTVGGRDPLATFLAQVHKASEVARVGSRSGLYQLVGAARPQDS
jgi:hypothetical protein